jgi:hypothetical protein
VIGSRWEEPISSLALPECRHEGWTLTPTRPV